MICLIGEETASADIASAYNRIEGHADNEDCTERERDRVSFKHGDLQRERLAFDHLHRPAGAFALTYVNVKVKPMWEIGCPLLALCDEEVRRA